MKIIRTRTRDAFESVHRVWSAWIEKYPFIVKTYHLFSWLSLVVLVISLMLVKESRTMLLQYMWSLYVVLQFWFLCQARR
ncbi:hypothetical protein [Paenibacillus sp. JCM 10914]